MNSTHSLCLPLLLLLTSACAHHASAPAPAAHEPAAHHGRMPHRFENAEEWAKRFEEPEREAWQKPDEVVKALGLAEDARVADVGSGTGYFAVRLARAVPRGKVYGVDVEPDMTRYLGERARREGLGNLEAVQGSPTQSKLPEPVDVVLIVDTYHHRGNRVGYMRELSELLRRGGRVAIIDFRGDSPKGPSARHKLSPEQVREEMRGAGYRLVRTHDFLPDQYFLEFEHDGLTVTP